MAKAKQGTLHDAGRSERDWWLEQVGGGVPAGWAARAFRLWFTPSATRKAVQGDGLAAQAYRDWALTAQSEEGKGNGQEA